MSEDIEPVVKASKSRRDINYDVAARGVRIVNRVFDGFALIWIGESATDLLISLPQSDSN